MLAQIGAFALLLPDDIARWNLSKAKRGANRA
jgi:hypothetical protein